jgi:hypothetical protein
MRSLARACISALLALALGRLLLKLLLNSTFLLHIVSSSQMAPLLLQVSTDMHNKSTSTGKRVVQCPAAHLRCLAPHRVQLTKGVAPAVGINRHAATAKVRQQASGLCSVLLLNSAFLLHIVSSSQIAPLLLQA